MSKWKARFQAQSNLSLKRELLHKGIISQIGESTCLMIQGSFKEQGCMLSTGIKQLAGSVSWLTVSMLGKWGWKN